MTANRTYASPEDLRQADLSAIPTDELTAEEQRELKRRFKEFVSAVSGQQLQKKKEPAKKKVVKWDPAALAKGGGKGAGAGPTASPFAAAPRVAPGKARGR